MAFKRVSSALKLLCLVLVLSGLCSSAPRSQFSMGTVGFHQYDLPDNSIDDGVHLDTREVEVTLKHPHTFMELYGWIPQMDDDISELAMSIDDNCVEFSIKIVDFKVCKYDRGITMKVGAFGISSDFIECRDISAGCAVNPIDSIAGKVGVKGMCLQGRVNVALHLCIGPSFWRTCTDTPSFSIGIAC